MDRLMARHVASLVEIAFRRTVRDKDIDPIRDRLPHSVEVFSFPHESPVEELRGIRSSEHDQFSQASRLMDQESDCRILVGLDQAFLDRRRMVSGDENLLFDIESREPSKKIA